MPTAMRPCDGTSGLVRGNRRKAVFAFKGLFSGRVSLRFPSLAARFYHVFRKCGEKSETSERNPIFANKNRRSWKPKTGVWSVDLGFSSHFRKRLTEVCGKFWNFRAHRSFHGKKPQVEALLLSGVLGMSRICRILLIISSFRSGICR